MLVTRQTALAPHHPAISPGAAHAVFTLTGLTATALRQDRILDEARHTSDPVHLMRLFGICPATALRYIHAAHPEKAGHRPR
ncbi:hypothetical protein ADK54_41855 [Streptomyces sp. WM6378]|nr:hypothetical protein ADK54_41855 [Streptomyces sp. WM6378]